MIGRASGCGLCPWSSLRKVEAYDYIIIVSYLQIMAYLYVA